MEEENVPGGVRKKSGVSMARFEEKILDGLLMELYGEIVKDLVQQGLMQIEGDRVRMTKERSLFRRHCSRTIYFGVERWV